MKLVQIATQLLRRASGGMRVRMYVVAKASDYFKAGDRELEPGEARALEGVEDDGGHPRDPVER
jgi:hypothetical protein